VISELPSDAKKQNGTNQAKNETTNQKQGEVKKVVNEPANQTKEEGKQGDKKYQNEKQPEHEQTQVPQKWKTEETLDTKNVIFDQKELVEDKERNEPDKTEEKEQ